MDKQRLVGFAGTNDDRPTIPSGCHVLSEALLCAIGGTYDRRLGTDGLKDTDQTYPWKLVLGGAAIITFEIHRGNLSQLDQHNFSSDSHAREGLFGAKGEAASRSEHSQRQWWAMYGLVAATGASDNSRQARSCVAS